MITANPSVGTVNGESRLRLTVNDVTGTHTAELPDVDPGLRVRDVADTVAQRMSLPVDGTTWALRTESTARYLEDVTIGEALRTEQGTSVSLVLTPRAHLG
ncbi:MAG: hypothetical protein ACYTG1_09230 [Planctomycetota bacterium]|jgi:hypothetical protein